MQNDEQELAGYKARFRGMTDGAIQAERATWRANAIPAVAATMVLQEREEAREKSRAVALRGLIFLIVVALVVAGLAKL